MKALLLLLVMAVGITGCRNHQKEATGTATPRPDSTPGAHVQYWDRGYQAGFTSRDSVFKQPDNWQKGFGVSHDPQTDSVWNQPVAYYISDKKCARLAIDFYYGRLRPSDDAVTDSLLALATTGDDKLRPFYRWCLNKTILIQDGALGFAQAVFPECTRRATSPESS